MNIIVSGSMANDVIMKYPNKFKDLIIKDDLENLNLGLVIDEIKHKSGGVGLNIAYNLGLLGLKNKCKLIGVIGNDFKTNSNIKKNVKLKYLLKDKKTQTATAYMITDKKGNQIIPFFPGPLSKGIELSTKKIKDTKYSIVGANDKNSMLKYLQESYENGIDSFFCAGQMTGLLNKEDLLEASKYATNLICNEYEFNLYQKKTNLNSNETRDLFERVVITKGKNGVTYYEKNEEVNIQALKIENVVEPTGAGDSFVAGLVGGLYYGNDRETSIKLGCVIASFVIQKNGAIEHTPSKNDIKELFQNTYQGNLYL